VENFEFHTHFEGVAGHSHGEGSSRIVEMRFHGVGRLDGPRVPRLRRPQDRPGDVEGIPTDCAAVLRRNAAHDLSPWRERSPLDYLARGRRAILITTSASSLSPSTAGLRNIGVVVDRTW